MIRLIAGLGNPGEEHESTRHNAGFWFVDALCRRYRLEPKPVRGFHGLHVRGPIEGRPVSVLKPTTWMNRSGRSVAATLSWYRYADDEALVVHDELDLPVGAVRLKFSGGHGGHNGLRDVVDCIGDGFHRLRIGIGRPNRVGKALSWVLGRPGADDEAAIRAAIERALDHLPRILEGEMPLAMNTLHRNDPTGR